MTADFFGNVVVAPSVADVAAGMVVVAAVVVVYAPVAAPLSFPHVHFSAHKLDSVLGIDRFLSIFRFFKL